MIISSALYYNFNTSKAVAVANLPGNLTSPNEARLPSVASSNESTAAVNPSNITSVTNSIISNISSTKNFAKIGDIDVKSLSRQAKISLATKETGKTSETVLPTRAGYNDTKAYLQAKIGSSAAEPKRDQTIFDFSPYTASSLISTNATGSAGSAVTPAPTSSSTSSSQPSRLSATGSPQSLSTAGPASALTINQTARGRDQLVKVNMVLNDSLDIISGCGILRCSPSDNQVGVGPNHVLQMVNVAGKVWTKNDGNSVQYFALKDFFRTGNDQISDPYVFFDPDSGRWFTSLFDVTSESYHIAVSKTDDPTGSWTVYNLASFDSCPDQGRFAVNRDLFVISVNDFGPKCSNGFKGVQFTIASKQDLINSASTIRSQTQPVNPSLFSLLPVQPLTVSPTMFMASVGDFGTSSVELISINGIPPNATVTPSSVPITPTVAPPPANQPQLPNPEVGPFFVDTGDGRISSASYRDGKIWIAFNDECKLGMKRDCIRLIQLDTTNLKKPIQDFDVAARGADVYYPTLSIDNGGNMILAFGISSTSIFPSIMITAQNSSSTLNTVEKPVFLIKATAPDATGRYGDYDGSALDSNTNIWITHQYNKSTSGWSTLIASLSHGP